MYERERIITRALEIRESGDASRIHGIIVQEGRAATGGRAEVFAPLSVVWPSDGIGILTEHLGAMEARAVPQRENNGEIKIEAILTPNIREAFESGRKFLSVEFRSEQESRTAGGVREITRAFVSDVAMVLKPEYEMARSELRYKSAQKKKKVYRPWL